MKSTSSTSKLLKGAAMLSIAAILTKLLGTLQKIPLQNIGGDVVFGIYNTVYPFYMVMITLAIAGIPTAISKFVAEREAAGDSQGSQDVLRISSVMLIGTGAVFGAGMYFGAPIVAEWIGNRQLMPALRSIAPALFVIPMAAALRGYFQGLQDMVPTAVSQVIEQAVRVTVMICFLFYLTNMNASESLLAGAAMGGSAAGGLAALIVMLLYLISHKRNRRTINEIPSSLLQTKEKRNTYKKQQSRWNLCRDIFIYAIPICFAALAMPLISLVDTFTMPRMLTQGGMDEIESMLHMGIYNRGIPLVQLVTMFATSLSVLFIPAMAELKFNKDGLGIQRGSTLTLRWFWLLGLAATVGLVILAEPINIMLYQNELGSDTMRWIAATAAPATMMTVSAALLQGLGSVKAPALHLMAAAVLKTGLNIWLVPELGINGAAVAAITAYTLAAVLNIILLLKLTGIRLQMASAGLKPLFVVGLMACTVIGLLLLLKTLGMPEGRLYAMVESLLGVSIGAVVFVLGVLKTGLLTEQEMMNIPRIGPKLIRLLRLLKINPLP